MGGCVGRHVFRTFPTPARVCGTSDSRYDTRMSRAPMLKFVQLECTGAFDAVRPREGLKAVPLLLLGCWGTVDALPSTALLCASHPTRTACPVNNSRFRVGARAKNAEDGSHARLWITLLYSGTCRARYLYLLVSLLDASHFFRPRARRRQGVYASS